MSPLSPSIGNSSNVNKDSNKCIVSCATNVSGCEPFYPTDSSDEENLSPENSIINITDSPVMVKSRSSYEFGDSNNTSNKENIASPIESTNGNGDFKKTLHRSSDLSLKESQPVKLSNSMLDVKVVLTPFDIGKLSRRTHRISKLIAIIRHL